MSGGNYLIDFHNSESWDKQVSDLFSKNRNSLLEYLRKERELSETLNPSHRFTEEQETDMNAFHKLEKELKILLERRRIRCFHHTKLLDHEIKNVREHGLKAGGNGQFEKN